MKIWIEEGKHDWRPADIPVPLCRRILREIVYEIEFDKSCWYNWRQADGKQDKDQSDWNKGGGVTNMWNANNVDSFMWAWNADPDFQWRFNLTAYSNIGKNKRLIGNNADGQALLRVYATEKVTITIKPEKNRGWSMKIENTGRAAYSWHTHESKMNTLRTIGSWFGGENNSPGPWGGVAPHDMKMNVSRKIKLF